MKPRQFVALLLCTIPLAFGGVAGLAHADDGGSEHESREDHDGSGHSEHEDSHERGGSGSDHDGSGRGGSDSNSGGSQSSRSSESSHRGEEKWPAPSRRESGDRKAPKTGRGRPAAHDSARVAVTSGAVVPYKDVLKQLEHKGAGRVLHVQLTIGSVRSIYELKVEDKQGNISTVTVDAGTGSILSAGGN